MSKVRVVRGTWCLLLGLTCALAVSTARADVIALKRDAGLTTGGAIGSQFNTAFVVPATVADAPLYNAANSRWMNGGRSAIPGGTYQLYKFDLSMIPAGATINLAQLRLYHTMGNSSGCGVAQVLTHDWTEGVCTGAMTQYPGAAGGVTYAHPIGYCTNYEQNADGTTASPHMSWGTSNNAFFTMGVDTGSITNPSSAPAGEAFSVFPVTSHVQDWVSGTKPNYGWAQPKGNWNFHMSEIGTEYQPVLFVDYTAATPTVTLSASSTTIAEAGGTSTLTATLSRITTQTVTVNLAYTGTAASGTDYSTTGSSIVINPGSLTGTATITATDDSTYEGNETAIVDISSVTNGTESGTQQVTVTITEDDQPTIIALKRHTGLTDDSSTDARFNTASVVTTTVNDALVTNSGNGRWYNYGTTTAAPGSSAYMLCKFNLSSIPAGSTINMAQLRFYRGGGNSAGPGIGQVLTHDWTEGTKNATYPGASGGSSYAHPIGTNTTYNRNKDNGTSTPWQSWGTTNDQFFSMGGDCGTTVNPSPTPLGGAGYHVYPVTSHVQAWVNGTLPNYGWAFSTGNWTFNTSEIANQSYEPVLFVDFNPAPPTVTLSRNNATFSEAAGTCTLTATLSRTSTQAVTVTLAYSGTATSGTDYTAATSITVNAGQLTGTTNITAVNDTTYEGSETVVVDISSVTGGTESGTQQVSSTITDNDSQPSVTLIVDDTSIDEEGGKASITATLSNPTTQTVTVNLSFSGTATADTDYTSDDSVIIIPGDISGTLTGTHGITAVDDDIYEGGETVVVDIASVTNGTESGTQQVTVTIMDNDLPPSVTLGIDNTNIPETGGSAMLTATLSRLSTSNVTVSLDYSGGTAVRNTDFSANTAITVSAGSWTGTTSVTATGDSTYEGDETIVVDIADVTGGTEDTVQQVTATLVDDDSPPVSSFTLKQYTGGSYTFANTPDTLLDSYSGTEKQYNYGGMTNYGNIYTNSRPYLVSFDLNAIPDKNLVTAVNSATLRLYRIGYQFANTNYKVAQLAQDWVEGTATSGTSICDGAQWINRNSGTVVNKTTFADYGGGIWYITGVSDLGDDPINAGKKHVRPANDNTNYYNKENVYTHCASLASLQGLGATRGYYWDSGASRLYLNKNDLNIRWYKSTDHWTINGGTITGSYVNDATYPGKPATAAVWIEFNVTSIVSNWLISGQGNYGFQMLEIGNGGGNFAASEYTTDQTLRPELVVTLTFSAAPFDSTAPGQVTTLATSNADTTSIDLSWTAPGDDTSSGTATSYDIRYSFNPIDSNNWGSATQVLNEPTPAAYGTNQSMTIQGLTPDREYYFAMKASDEVPNTSVLSNVASGFTLPIAGDETAPAAISNLATSAPTGTTIKLTWTAPGDDNSDTGTTAAKYDIRYRTGGAVTDSNWASATQVTGEPLPKVAGSAETFTVPNLSASTTYYFAIKTSDEVPNTSLISNSPSGTTTSSVDTTAPAAIADFHVMTADSGYPGEGQRQGASSLQLLWHPTGDDGTTGTANHYELRYSTSSINDGNWASTTPYTYNLPSPPKAYSATAWEGLTVGGLQPDTLYYFGIKAVDEAGNASSLATDSGPTLHDHDIIAPSMVQDLAVSNILSDRVTLTWKASGDDWIFLTAASYDVRYITAAVAAPSTTMTNDAWFWKATKVPCTLTPQAYGSTETFTVTGLNANTKYYFAVRAVDEQMNWSGMALMSATTSTASDSTAPAAISTLAASNPSSGTVRLTWNAPGDDGSTGTATTYDIRYRTGGAVNDSNWGSATQATGELAPKVAGTTQTWTVYGLTAGQTYYFAIKTADETPNWSAISNCPAGVATLASNSLNKPVLTQQDFEYLGAFRLPTTAGSYTTDFATGGIAIRYNPDLRFLATAATCGLAVYECNFPGWGSNSSYYSCPLATVTYNWGTAVEGSWLWPQLRRQGLLFDTTSTPNRFYYSWGSSYNTNGTNMDCLAWTELVQGAPVIHGPWKGPGWPAANSQRIRGGSTIIPDWFANAYLGGRKLGLGFGGYYSGVASCSRGPFLAAAFHPTDGVPTLDTINLIDYPLSHVCTRDTDYYYTPATAPDPQNPIGADGWWTWCDIVFGAGIWIDLSDKHGMVFMPTLSSGHSKYWAAANSCERSDVYFKVYDPKDLAAVAQGTKSTWNAGSQEWKAEVPSLMTAGVGGGGDTGLINGLAFDPQTRILYGIAPGSYQSNGQHTWPVVHGWHIKQ